MAENFNTNRWNRIRYTFYKPIYDPVAWVFRKSRKLSIDSLEVKSGESVLLLGCGTGLDLNCLPKDCRITAIDITPAMVNRTLERAKTLGMEVDARVMDGQNLEFDDNTFDHVVLHMILAVIPDSTSCIREAARVLKPGGKAVAFDKFIEPYASVSKLRSVVNSVTDFLMSDINTDIIQLIEKTELEVVHDIEADFAGNYRRLLMTKTD